MNPEDDDENPYERWGIDPRGGPPAITERMRELVEDAPDEAAKKAIRAAWEELTLHPARRLRAALGTHPETHDAHGTPPSPPRRASATGEPLELADLAVRPSICAALGLDAPSEHLDVPFDRDPILTD